jgi:hypothetical protein
LNAASKEYLAAARKEVGELGPPAGSAEEVAKEKAAGFVVLAEEIIGRYR